MFFGERYTLTPVALAGNESEGWHVVNGAGMSWNSPNTGVAAVSSSGQVEAMGVGTTSVEVQSGGASKQIPIEVRSGTRPTGSNQEADLDIGNCSEEQASMYAPYASQAKKDASAQQGLILEDGVVSDEDPAPLANSRAAHFRNAVGNPRFTPKNRGSAAVPTSTQLGSYSYQFNMPVASVGGRGASASIGMTFNSRVWNVDDGKLTFNYVGAYPAPGWSMGYGKIMGMNGAGGITNGVEVAYTTYNYNQVGILDDFPQFTQREEWWLDKTDPSGEPATAPTTYVYSRTTNATTEEATVEHVGKHVKEVTTTGTDSIQQLSFGKVVSVVLKKNQPAGVLSKQAFTYMTGPAGEAEIEKVETFDEAG